MTKEHLQATVEEVETSNEELKSSNEELLSTNEELQSANEELQTSKEELQSVNEELETINAELKQEGRGAGPRQRRPAEPAPEHPDPHRCSSTASCASSASREAATQVFRLIETDVGRPIADIAPRFEGDLVPDMKEVLRTLVATERQVRVADGPGDLPDAHPALPPHGQRDRRPGRHVPRRHRSSSAGPGAAARGWPRSWSPRTTRSWAGPSTAPSPPGTQAATRHVRLRRAGGGRAARLADHAAEQAGRAGARRPERLTRGEPPSRPSSPCASRRTAAGSTCRSPSRPCATAAGGWSGASAIFRDISAPEAGAGGAAAARRPGTRTSSSPCSATSCATRWPRSAAAWT